MHPDDNTLNKDVSQKNILIIEDDEDVRALLEFLLKREGFGIEFAIDGEQASERIRKGETPDLILLDILMPFRDGFEILQEIKSNAEWKDIPVFMLTGSDKENNIVKGFEHGISDYLTKPFKPGELVARIRRALKQ